MAQNLNLNESVDTQTESLPEYEELIGRFYDILHRNNPELAEDRRRTAMRPFQVLREGPNTVLVNFMDICRTMDRKSGHVMDFLLAKMGTNGNLDGQQRLVVRGRFTATRFEGILRTYINEYVICNGCKSLDTILSRKNRLLFLGCEKCGSGRYVARVGRKLEEIRSLF